MGIRLSHVGRRLLLGLVLGGALVGAGVEAWAAQVSFSVQRQSGSAVFAYRFSDAWRQVWPLSFILPFNAVEAGYSYWAGFRPDVLTQKVREALQNYAQRYNGQLSIRVDQMGNGYQYSYRGPVTLPFKAIEADLHREAERAGQTYLAEHYLVLHNRTVMVDYGRITQLFTRALSPIAQAFAALVRGDDRQKLMIALAFVQSIPYDTAPDRAKLGFATPPAMLWQNRGDCDTKTVALAAILGTLLPSYATAIVLVPGHALLGIAMPPAQGDRLYAHQGRTYVLLEPVGPALSKIGELSPRSGAALAKGDGVIIMPVPR